jgi:hypothetical protein
MVVLFNMFINVEFKSLSNIFIKLIFFKFIFDNNTLTQFKNIKKLIFKKKKLNFYKNTFWLPKQTNLG